MRVRQKAIYGYKHVPVWLGRVPGEGEEEDAG